MIRPGFAKPPGRSFMILAFTVRVFLAGCVVSRLVACQATVGDDDKLDTEIDNATVGVRHDRAWHDQNPLARVPRLDSYEPATATASSRRAPSRWRYSLSPFAWVPAIEGNLKVHGHSVDVDLSPADLLETVVDNFDFAGMARFEAGRSKWSFIADVIYLGIGNDGTAQLPTGAQVDVDWTFDMLIIEGFVGYRFAELSLGCQGKRFTPTVALDALAGARYYHLGLDLDLDPGPSVDGSKDWIDPVVGLRAQFHLTPDLTFNVFGDVGGFGLGSDLSWQLIAGVNWKIAKCVSLDAGWMVLDVDYESGTFAFDVNFSGPYISATFRF
jgi:hypothetical protein